MPDEPELDPVALLDRATPDTVRDVDYHQLAVRAGRQRHARRGVLVTTAVLTLVVVVVLVAQWAPSTRVDVVDLQLDELPAAGAPGWPIDVVHRIDTLSTPDLDGPHDRYTTKFVAESWSDWTYESVGDGTMNGRPVRASEFGGCSARIGGRSGSCDGTVDPAPDQVGDVGPMGPAVFIRPLAGEPPESVDYRPGRLTMADGSQRRVVEAAREIQHDRCANTGYTCDDPSAPVTETIRIVADQATWVPLIYDVDIEGTGVIHVEAISIDGIDIEP